MVEPKLVIRDRTTCVKCETIQNMESHLETFQLSGGRRPKRCGLFVNRKVSDKKKPLDWENDGANQAFSQGGKSVSFSRYLETTSAF